MGRTACNISTVQRGFLFGGFDEPAFIVVEQVNQLALDTAGVPCPGTANFERCAGANIQQPVNGQDVVVPTDAERPDAAVVIDPQVDADGILRHGCSLLSERFRDTLKNKKGKVILYIANVCSILL